MFTCAVILLLIISNVELRLLVHTEVGSIQGVPADDGDYVMFLGIPYARVNASNPFGASLPYPKFNKVFEANDDSIICPQFIEDDGIYDGTIECLRVNVYVPNTDNDNKAVFVYIFGGDNKHGHKRKSLYGPKYLVQHGIIMVTLNYRLGPYGFFCTNHPEIAGNQALKDQYTAIKWVRDNIRAFGGDPQKITIGGHSSGSMCVDAHLRTKQPRLFQQAILQSGTATHPRFIVPPNNTAILDIADKLGFKTTDFYKAMSFLAKINPEFIVNISKSMDWKVCIEKKFEGVFRYISEHPEASEANNVHDMNILGGITSRECIFCIYGDSYKALMSKSDILEYELNLKFDFKENDKAYERVRRFYYEDANNIEQNTNATIEFLSDYDFVHPMQRGLVKYSRRRNTTVFQYLFSYNSDRSIQNRRIMHNVTEKGAAHTEELAYMFYFGEESDKATEEELGVMKIFTKLWTNFIKYGNPTPVRTELLPVSWPPLTANTVPCLQIDSNLTVISRPFQRNVAFWDLFFNIYKKNLRVAFTEKSSANVLSHHIYAFLISILYFCVN
ncbi:acetylcholinesterase-like [Aricia agestis]|uniref:acetylcholinesterase-like n=1 Tax=Aricia agestis TaxID=91739 RepID=UPI001C201E6A|nr:acetylcholinesterase-like [Aricia agestis]